MAESMSWVLVVLLTYNIALRFGSLTDIVVLTNLLTIIVIFIWGYNSYKSRKLKADKLKVEKANN